MHIKEAKTDPLFFLLIVLLGAAAVLFASGLMTPGAEPAASRAVRGITCAVIDPGHGVPDGGAVGSLGTEEKDINLDIALRLREILEGRGVKVIMTRDSDNGVYDEDASTIREKKISDMKNRRKTADESGADILVSIHMNSFPDSSVKGLHVFYSAGSEEAKTAAEAIQKRIAALTGAETHTVKTASETLFLMKDPRLPTVLVECGFLSNAEEEKKLRTEDYRSRIAYAIADALTEPADGNTVPANSEKIKN